MVNGFSLGTIMSFYHINPGNFPAHFDPIRIDRKSKNRNM